METLCVGGHTVYVRLPQAGLQEEGNPAILLNDGELIERLGLCHREAVLIGIVPKDRLSEYTPWPEKALRPGAPDFGGTMTEYHSLLLEQILPALTERYHLDTKRLAYGGFSLGGLAAAMSLWQTDRFCRVFSLCGSFWYPGVPEYLQNHPIVNTGAGVFLLNGSREGEKHGNRLQNAGGYARQVHSLLAGREGTVITMDAYAHHDHIEERFAQAMAWLADL